MPKRPYATYQLTGTRSHQCDATAVRTIGARRAYALLDGIGSSQEVRDWTRAAARRLVNAVARAGDAEQALRRVHTALAEENDERALTSLSDLPYACAVVALLDTHSRTLQVAWTGDSRAYLLRTDGTSQLLTKDHNLRQALLDQGRVPGPYDRNHVLSCLGSSVGENEIGAVTVAADGQLLLASDGAYEPIEDAGSDVGNYLQIGSPSASAQLLVRVAVGVADPGATDNTTVLIADLDRL